MTPPPLDTSASLAEVNRTIDVPPKSAPWWRKALAFVGPGYLVAVGYMDPGNWATDLAGGSQFGYELLVVILLANCMAMLLQALSAKLGIVTGNDLAQACRKRYPKPVAIGLWIACEIAIIACDLAEVLGTAIALQLLFGLPLLVGVCLTAFDVLVILALQQRGFRLIEAFVACLLLVIAGCFAWELAQAHPALAEVAKGLVPSPSIVTDPAKLYIAIGILGATVMPHNLYLHSSIVQTRRFEKSEEGKRSAIRLATLDSCLALGFALLINAAILVLAAAAFHGKGAVAEIEQAYHLLAPTLGAGAASVVFAVALLASGQNSTVTGTLAGQIVAEGFVNLRMKPWLRRAVTRGLAIIPAVLVLSIAGEGSTTKLLVLSQVVLSLQLPLAVIPLVRMTGDKVEMGAFANRWRLAAPAYLVTALIVCLNAKLVWDAISGG